MVCSAIVTMLALSCSTANAGRPRVGLSGAWRFQLDERELGVEGAWYDGLADPGRIAVPGSWEAQGYGSQTSEVWHSFTGWGWYERGFRAPGRWRGKGSVILHLGPVHRAARVWLNGSPVFEKLGYVTYSERDVTDRIRWGETNRLTVLVDSEQHPEVDGLAGCIDTYDFARWGGIYGHCWLELRPEMRIEDVFVRAADRGRTARVRAEVRGAGEVRCHIDSPDGAQRFEASTNVGGDGPSEIDLRVPMRAVRLWSPEEPHLYDVTIELVANGRTLDSVSTRTGFRDIAVRGSDIYLNGDRIFLRGYGDDACYPLTVSPPADKRFWLERFRIAKAYGFNFVRHHSHVPVQEYFDAADEIGMLVQPELPIAYEHHVHNATPAALRLFREEWRGIIVQYRHHPSVAIWCMGNEAWHSHSLADDLYRDAYDLDGTRPVCDTDGVPRDPYGLGGTRDTLDVHHVQFDEQTIPWGADLGKYELASKPVKPVTVHEMGNFVAFYDPRDARRYTGLTKPSWLVGDESPAPIAYRSHREENARLWIVRQLGEPWRLEWRTERVPAAPADEVTFAFTAATGWTTEPAGYFALHLNGKALLRFNLPEGDRATWRSADGRSTLVFDVYEGGIDQFGVMYLTVPGSLLTPGEPALLTVTGSDSGSRRWFGLYDYMDTPLALGQGQSAVNGFVKLIRWARGEGTSVTEVARLRGTTELLPTFVANSRKLQALCRKLNTEAARRSAELDGYTLWLLQDYWKGGQGLLNQFYEPKGVSASEHRKRNSATVVLLDRDTCVVPAGGRIAAAAVVSHFGTEELAQPALTVQLTGAGRRRIALGNIAPGSVTNVAAIDLAVPDVSAPTKLTLRLTLADGALRCGNEWDYWAFPEREPLAEAGRIGVIGGDWLATLYPGIRPLAHGEPIPDDVQVLVAGSVSPRLLDALVSGRSVVLLSTSAFAGDELRFKSPWWFPQPRDSNLGTIVAPHPALGRLPHEGWCDLVWYDMVEGARAVHHDGTPLAGIWPIIQAIDLPTRQLTRSLLLEAKVGEGRLLACSLELSRSTLERSIPAEHLLDGLLRYATSDELREAASLSPDDLRRALVSPDLARTTLVEGFSRVLEASDDPHSGQTSAQPASEPSVRGENVRSWFARQRDDRRFVSWQTAAAPADLSTGTVTLVWTGVLGWKSEAEGRFRLHIGEEAALEFHVTDQSATWESADRAVQLRFAPEAWNGADTLGTFALEVPVERVEPGKPLTLAVRAYGGSMRWFGLQEYRDTIEWLYALR